MKETIKAILREDVKKNSLNIVVTRPDQKLIIMRGIPGAGKSTKAKSLVGEGVIHSTDEVIEAKGDYREFFKKMVESKNFFPLMNAHGTNLKNAIKSMTEGISPVIVDNTNIKANEPKKYVVEALKLGYDDANISIVDIGTAGLDAKTLSERNSHGVPLEKIEMMMASHKGQGELTLKKILEAKDMFDGKKAKVLYSAIVLTEKSRAKLIAASQGEIPDGWDIFAHHMTIVFGKELPANMKPMLGKTVEITATKFGRNDLAMSVLVDGFESLNDKPPHVTLAVNTKGGGKPVDGGLIDNWVKITPIKLSGVVTEVKPTSK
jgi:predicted kinase